MWVFNGEYCPEREIDKGAFCECVFEHFSVDLDKTLSRYADEDLWVIALSMVAYSAVGLELTPEYGGEGGGRLGLEVPDVDGASAAEKVFLLEVVCV